MSRENVESFERGTEAYNRRDVEVIESSGSATSARGASRVGR